MESPASIAYVLKALESLEASCRMDEFVEHCPELTWNQVFLAIDLLSRTGRISVMRDSDGQYFVRVNWVGTPKTESKACVPC